MSFIIERPEWFDQAACRGRETALFFPNEAHAGARDVFAAARLICARCPVTEPCAELGMAEPESGMWGGIVPMTEIRRARRAS